MIKRKRRLHERRSRLLEELTSPDSVMKEILNVMEDLAVLMVDSGEVIELADSEGITEVVEELEGLVESWREDLKTVHDLIDVVYDYHRNSNDIEDEEDE